MKFTIVVGVCQDTLMSTKRTLMSLGCGDSSRGVMVTLNTYRKTQVTYGGRRLVGDRVWRRGL
jgi:hypothetical protein